MDDRMCVLRCQSMRRLPCSLGFAASLLLTVSLVHVLVDSRVASRALIDGRQNVRAALPVNASLAVLTWLRRFAVADGLACARAGRLSRGIACVLPLRSC